MLKIRIDKIYEIDDAIYEKWCIANRVGKNAGRVYLRKKIYEAGKKVLCSENLLKPKTDLKWYFKLKEKTMISDLTFDCIYILESVLRFIMYIAITIACIVYYVKEKNV